MALTVTPSELRKMQLPELRREADRKRLDVAKMRLESKMRSLKDTAKYRRERTELARVLTILRELERGQQQKAPRSLKFKRKASTVSARATAKPTGEAGLPSSSR